jgi:hypothetical protein
MRITNVDRDIVTDDKKIAEFVDSLAGGRFLIPSCLRQWGFDFYKGEFK